MTARLLPKTLFGEKYVDLVAAAAASQERLVARVTSSRRTAPRRPSSWSGCSTTCCRCCGPSSRPSSTPRSTRSPPRSRAGASGSARTSSCVDDYFAELNPQLPAIEEDISGLADVSQIYADAAPDLLRILRNVTVTDQHHPGQVRRATPGSSPAPPASRRRPAGCLDENERPAHPAGRGRPAHPRPARQVLARVPVPAPGAGRSPTTSSARRSPTASCTSPSRSSTRARAYEPGRGARVGRATAGRTATACPTRRGRGRASKFRDGTKGNGSAAARPGRPGRPAERSRRQRRGAVPSSTRSSRPQMGVPADEVPDLATLLFGPMARGTAVGQS